MLAGCLTDRMVEYVFRGRTHDRNKTSRNVIYCTSTMTYFFFSFFHLGPAELVGVVADPPPGLDLGTGFQFLATKVCTQAGVLRDLG